MRLHPTARVLLALALAVLPASAASGGENHILYLASETIEAPSLKQHAANFAGKGVKPFVLAMGQATTFPPANARLTPKSRASADGLELCEQVRNAKLLVLSGGTFMEWYDTVYPRGPVTNLSAALRDYYQSKRPIIAQGGACAFLSGGILVDRSELPEPERNPRRKSDWEARLAVGMGPQCLFDSDSWKGSSPLRLLQAQADTGVDLAAYFVGEVGLDFDRVSEHHEVLGPGLVLLFDLRRARTVPEGIREGRISLLRHRDAWRTTEQRLRPHAEEMLLRERAVVDTVGRDLDSWKDQPGPSVAQLIDWLALAGSERETRAANDSTWTLGWDALSRRWPTDQPYGLPTWINLPFDCRWPKR